MRLTIKTGLLPVHLIFLLISFSLRLYLSATLPLVPYPDTETYELFALESINGLDITMPTRPLGYPLFIAMVYKALGAYRENVVYVQHALGALSYLLYFSVFSFFFRRGGASLLAFIAASGGLFLVYERAVLSDFLNHFMLLLAIFIFFKYLEGRKAWLMVPLGAASVAAVAIRPNSAVFAGAVAVFLLIRAALELRRRAPAASITALGLFLAVVLALNFGFHRYAQKKIGFAGEPVGVFGLTMLIRTADYIDYDSALHRDLKEKYRDFLKVYLPDYAPAYSNFLAGYSLMMEVECVVPGPVRKAYDDAARSAGSFYGAHRVGDKYFTIYDVLRDAKCDMGTMEEAFLDISKEAVLKDPLPFSRSVIASVMDFLEAKPWEPSSFSRFGSERGVPFLAVLMKGYAMTDLVLGNVWVTRALTALFILGAATFFVRRRPGREAAAAAFLVALLLVNYLLLGVIAAAPAPRYKLINWWIQLLCFCYFASVSLGGLKGRWKKEGP